MNLVPIFVIAVSNREEKYVTRFQVIISIRLGIDIIYDSAFNHDKYIYIVYSNIYKQRYIRNYITTN